jgi:diguanylate cyclase (GGDEF)-like protein
MAVLEDGGWTVLDTASGLPSNVAVITKSRADDGSPALWIGTEGGLLRFEHGRFTLYDERSGLPIRIIWKVLETTSPGGLRTVWLGTWGGGVVRLSPNAWAAFDATTGVPSGAVTSLLATRKADGREVVWAGTSDGELARLEGERFRSVELPPALRHAIVFSLLETRDPDGGRSLWVGSFGGGLGRLKGGRWTVLDPSALPNPRVYTVVETAAEDGSAELWVGTEGGLGRLARGRWTHFRKGAELPSEIVTQVLETRGEDGARTLWVGTSRGIARLSGGRWTALGKQAGLLSENVADLELTADADGTRWLWAGTFAGGASRVRLDDPRGRFETFSTTTSPALPSDTVMSIAQDAQRRIYLCTTRGISRLTPRRPTPDDPAPFSAELFTVDDGLPSGDCQPAARLVDAQGRVWAGTARGLAMFDPRREVADRAPKPLVVRAAVLSDRARTLRGGETLSHAERNLSFEYALLAYGGEARIRYRHQLVGFDPAPSGWTPNAAKEYTNLGAGEYVFQAWGRDARGNLSGPVALSFRIRPAPWATAWALAAYSLCALAAAYGALQWRVRVLSRRAERLEAVVAERTAELAASKEQLERLASLDALTGLANRRSFDAALAHEWKRAQRSGHWLSLALLDVDFFKRFNDRYGHARGDDCLRAVAQAVAARCRRPTDLVARYGGEEFALVLPEAEPAGVARLLAAVLAGVDALGIAHAESDCASHVTVTLGAVSLKPGPGADGLAALERADRLLYQAKQGGRHHALHDDGSGAVRRVGADPLA